MTWRSASTVPRGQPITNTVCAPMNTRTHTCTQSPWTWWEQAGGELRLLHVSCAATLGGEPLGLDARAVAALGPAVQTNKSTHPCGLLGPSFRSLVLNVPRACWSTAGVLTCLARMNGPVTPVLPQSGAIFTGCMGDLMPSLQKEK